MLINNRADFSVNGPGALLPVSKFGVGAARASLPSGLGAEDLGRMKCTSQSGRLKGGEPRGPAMPCASAWALKEVHSKRRGSGGRKHSLLQSCIWKKAR